MRMNHALDIRPHLVNREVHGDFAGALGAAGDFVALHVDDDEVVAAHHALAYPGGGGEDAFGVQADSDIAVVGGHPALLEHQLADSTDVLAILALSLYHAECSIVA